MFDVELVNRTPFAAATHVQMDGDGQEVLVVVVCASFTGDDGPGPGPLRLADPQAPVRDADEPRGDPARSSLAHESDVSPFKPRVDVVVQGHACAPPGRAVTQRTVSLRVADIDKTLRVTGDRLSRHDADPLPFTRLPLVYERAFGGTTAAGDCYRQNPVGIGFRGAVSADPAVRSWRPNIEYADRRAARRGGVDLPAGFGIVARHWLPRLPLAGTYDDAWRETTWPLPPADFDPAFHQVAPLDQQTARLDGGEIVDLEGLTPAGRWRFRLPVLDLPVHLVHEDRIELAPLRIDTLAIDADRRLVTLKSRLALRRRRNAPALRAVVLGHASPGWLQARRQSKAWRGRPGLEVLDRPCFRA